MTLEPDKLRQSLFEIRIPMARGRDLAEVAEKQALEGCASSIYRTCVQCCLVGLFDIARELFPKARVFLQAAIERQEVPNYYFPGGTEASRFEILAMCAWFIDRKHDLESLRQAVRWREKGFSNCEQLDKTEVQLTLPVYLDGEEYDLLISRFESVGLTAPKNIRQIQAEGTMSYVLARQRLGLDHSASETRDALERFLTRNVPQWCEGGHTSTVAHWMKLAHWHPGDDPIATLLKCYDYLPGLEPPAYAVPAQRL